MVVSINHFTFDSDAEIALLQQKCADLGADCVVSRHWAEGSAGAEALAEKVMSIVDAREAQVQFTYEDQTPLWDKLSAVATKLYGAKEIVASAKVKKDIEQLQANYGHLPICMAKTQMSFSTDPALKGAPSGHTVEISDVKLQNGAGFIVAIAGNMMTMPGLPTRPTAEIIDIDDEGVITGLF